jgi:hypothetical protein
MASDATIVEVPRPPAGRPPSPLLILRTIGNPVASWAQDFYDEPVVIQQILLDDADSLSKNPQGLAQA